MILTACLSGCGWVSQQDDSPYINIIKETTVHLTDDASSPYCDFSIDYSYLNETGDSIASLINRTAQARFLGEEFASLSPEAAVDSFMNVYIRDYRKETGELYQADLAMNGAETEVPQWYGQTYSLLTFWDEGYGGTMTVSGNYYVDMGGAHPNQWSQWMNFDFTTGKLLTKEDVFLSSAKENIESILLQKLIRQQAELNPEENIATLEDLQKLGILQLTNIYIPDNFLMFKEAVHFLFNRYDIAPYSAGEIVLEVPYTEIGPYLKF